MIHVSIPLPPDLQSWIESRVSDGSYANAADYFRALAERDRERNTPEGLRALIDQGLASPVLDEDPRDIIDAIIAENPDLRA